MRSKVKFRSSDTNFSTDFSETSYVAPPQPDWEQQDANRADYIKNKPDLNVYSTHEDARDYAENAAQTVREEHKEDQEITNEKFNILKEEVDRATLIARGANSADSFNTESSMRQWIQSKNEAPYLLPNSPFPIQSFDCICVSFDYFEGLNGEFNIQAQGLFAKTDNFDEHELIKLDPIKDSWRSIFIYPYDPGVDRACIYFTAPHGYKTMLRLESLIITHTVIPGVTFELAQLNNLLIKPVYGSSYRTLTDCSPYDIPIGKNMYIIEKDVPDYWWDGFNAQYLETQKVDLSIYSTHEEAQEYSVRAAMVVKEEIVEKIDDEVHTRIDETNDRIDETNNTFDNYTEKYKIETVTGGNLVPLIEPTNYSATHIGTFFSIKANGDGTFTINGDVNQLKTGQSTIFNIVPKGQYSVPVSSDDAYYLRFRILSGTHNGYNGKSCSCQIGGLNIYNSSKDAILISSLSESEDNVDYYWSGEEENTNKLNSFNSFSFIFHHGEKFRNCVVVPYLCKAVDYTPSYRHSYQRFVNGVEFRDYFDYGITYDDLDDDLKGHIDYNTQTAEDAYWIAEDAHLIAEINRLNIVDLAEQIGNIDLDSLATKEYVDESDSFIMGVLYGELDAISEIVEIPPTDPDQAPDARRIIKNDNIDWSTVTNGLQTILDALNAALDDGEV